MELQQRFPVSMNEYEDSETAQRSAFQTEDIYQCLQYRPPAAQGTINSTTLVSKMWLLHDDVFYLFWSEGSDCSAAESFCSKRNASLAILTEHNTDDEDHDCGIMTADVDTDHGEGFVCERRMNPIGTTF
ncbi:hypothetical protein ROHU_022881 [Labeo rohita]|uniref:Uncharacterized protein n=1 Tax=Labeo rohita TaxID=84645 RepID=A0A498L4B5_LABRO|nr:hypothetical protein ROHU_034503 [Labeo rohita]RXN23475.1 hypothetical protein ROHU_022881 [Labeo rohita]